MNAKMRKTETPATRPTVDLPENRHRWASNDEVEKPRVILRGPNILEDDLSAYIKIPNKRYLPQIAAYGIAGLTLACILIYIFLR